MLIWGIAVLIDEGSNLLALLNDYVDDGYSFIMEYVENLKFDEIKISGQVEETLKNGATNLLNNVSKWIADFITSIISKLSSIGTIGIYIAVTMLATYFICVDRMYILDQFEHHLPKDWVKKMTHNIKKITNLLGRILKSRSDSCCNKLYTCSHSGYLYLILLD